MRSLRVSSVLESFRSSFKSERSLMSLQQFTAVLDAGVVT